MFEDLCLMPDTLIFRLQNYKNFMLFFQKMQKNAQR